MQYRLCQQFKHEKFAVGWGAAPEDTWGRAIEFPIFQTSRKSLHDLVFGKTVTLVPVSTDPRGTSGVAHVRLGQLDASLEQVRRGMAWPNGQFVWDKKIIEAGAQAKRDKIGLWRDPHAKPPWVFRKGGQYPIVVAERTQGMHRQAGRRTDSTIGGQSGRSRTKAVARPIATPAHVQSAADWRPVPHGGERVAANAKSRAGKGTREAAGVSQVQVDTYLRQIPDAQPTKSGAFIRR